MKKYEYRLEQLDVDIKQALGQETSLHQELMAKLDELGQEGWRLCGTNGNLYYFTRENN